jgi:ERCC4-type nuclease/DNA-directed RNA polymerase subunit RPC12/RpoP
MSGPEFLEVKPKEIKKYEKIDERKDHTKEEISFWEPVEIVEKKGKGTSIKEDESNEFIEVPLKPEETEIKESEKIISLDEEKPRKIGVLKDLDSVDEKTAGLLYKNGYETIEALTNATIIELTKIKGIKRKTAKSIKKELNKKNKLPKKKWELIEKKEGPADEELPQWKTADFEFEEIIEKETKIEDEEKPEEGNYYCSECGVKIDKITNFCPECGHKIISDNEKQEEELPVFKQIEEVELKEEHVKKEEIATEESKKIEEMKNDIQEKTEEINKKEQIINDLKNTLKEKQKELENRDKEIKIQVFKDLESVDEKTAILLCHNGYETIETLTNATITELTKIKGIKRKTANAIKNELEKKHEWIQEEKKIAMIDETKEDEFKDIKSIDEKIARILRENGIDSIDALRNLNIKDLTKIRGIKRKIAKQIKHEIEKIPVCLEPTELEQEWEPIEEEIQAPKAKNKKGFSHGQYILYEKEMDTKSGKKKIVRFFSKSEPEDGKPIKLPKGYEVKENKKTGYPYLKKKK